MHVSMRGDTPTERTVETTQTEQNVVGVYLQQIEFRMPNPMKDYIFIHLNQIISRSDVHPITHESIITLFTAPSEGLIDIIGLRNEQHLRNCVKFIWSATT